MTTAKRTWKCEKCGKVFTSPRSLGKHYDENTGHRSVAKAVKPRKSKVELSSTARIEQAIDAASREIITLEKALADVEAIKKELAEKKKLRESLQAMVPKV